MTPKTKFLLHSKLSFQGIQSLRESPFVTTAPHFLFGCTLLPCVDIQLPPPYSVEVLCRTWRTLFIFRGKTHSNSRAFREISIQQSYRIEGELNPRKAK